jgi:hypothetical protein
MQTRLERFSKIRRLLGRPMEQKPDADQILSQMLIDEQTTLLRLANTGQGWNTTSFTLNVVAGQTEYPLAWNTDEPGKVFFVTREPDSQLGYSLPVRFNDMNNLDYGANVIPIDYMNEFGDGYFGLQDAGSISFVRRGVNGEQKVAVINPAPTVSANFKIYSFVSSIDRYAAELASSGVADELADYTDLSTVLALLPYTDWRKDDTQQNITYNSNKRRDIAGGIAVQLQRLTPIIDDYIRTMNVPTTFDMPHWNE